MGIVADDVRRVREQTDIVQLISEHTQLRKSGTQWMGLCPFHGENTPSFSVNYEMGVYHCFGCGSGGNVFSFLMEYLKINQKNDVGELELKNKLVETTIGRALLSTLLPKGLSFDLVNRDMTKKSISSIHPVTWILPLKLNVL